jgi:hypothetical protein
MRKDKWWNPTTPDADLNKNTQFNFGVHFPQRLYYVYKPNFRWTYCVMSMPSKIIPHEKLTASFNSTRKRVFFFLERRATRKPNWVLREVRTQSQTVACSIPATPDMQLFFFWAPMNSRTIVKNLKYNYVHIANYWEHIISHICKL